MKTKILLILLVLLTGISLSGCVSEPMRRNSSGEPLTIDKPLNVASNLKFDDVPIPAGFSIIRDQSFVFQNSAMRVGMMRYAGRASAEQALLFFKTQMALYNWDLQNVIEHIVSEMYFYKGDETCTISIEPLATKTLINIAISPRTGTFSTGLGLHINHSNK